jgi:hypothetical protein
LQFIQLYDIIPDCENDSRGIFMPLPGLSAPLWAALSDHGLHGGCCFGLCFGYDSLGDELSSDFIGEVS